MKLVRAKVIKSNPLFKKIERTRAEEDDHYANYFQRKYETSTQPSKVLREARESNRRQIKVINEVELVKEDI